MEVDVVDLRAKCVFFEGTFDFVVEDNTEDLHDGHALDLEILASAIASLGFGSATTLFDVVIVARNGGGRL
jgi:hypothetical protein